MSRIFLSHSSVDNAEAVGLRDWLAEHGWDDVFLDLDPERGIAAGERWERALHDAASRCEAVLFLISRAWLDSRWCQKELTLADKLNKRLFGVLIEKFDPTELPADLSKTWQVLDLASGRDHRLFRVTLPRTHEERHFTFSEEGLARLKLGLVRAGLDPRFFDWPPTDDPHRAPFRGLRALEAEDAGIFFGREAPIVEALDQLRGMREAAPPRLLAILGASGAGKSSFMRAGLFARLARDDRAFLPLPIIRPERDAICGEAGLLRALETALDDAGMPMARRKLRAAVAGGVETLRPVLDALVEAKTPTTDPGQAPDKPRLVISVDQGEELFRSEGHKEAQQLLGLLAGLLSQDAPALIVVIAIRSDSYAQLQEAKPLDGVAKKVFDLGPMPHGCYTEVINGPATRLANTPRRLKIQPALVDALLADIEAGGAKDALPLLSFTLERLYLENRGAGGLTLADYQALRGIKGSIEEAVERALDMADSDDSIPKGRGARLALLRHGLIPWLADIDPDTSAPRRRVARVSEIPAECRPLLRNLVEQRLLTTDQDRNGETTIEPAHEALLRQWSLLEGWLADDSELLAVLEGIKRAARDWNHYAKSPPWLTHSADRLTAAEQLSQRPDLAAKLDPLDREYLAACRKAEDERRATEERQREAELRAAQKVAAAEKVAKEEAEARANEAQAHAAVLRKRSRMRAMLAGIAIIALVAVLGLFALYHEDQVEKRYSRDAKAQELALEALAFLARGSTRGDDVRAFQELLAANKLAAKPDDEPLLDALRQRSSTDLIVNGAAPVVGVGFAEGGHRLAVADSGGLRAWDTSSPMWLQNLRTSACATGAVSAKSAQARCQSFPVNKHLTNVAISADGQVVAAGSQEGTVQVWNLNDQRPAPKSLDPAHQGRVTGVALSRDGHRLASVGADGVIEISNPDGTDMHSIATGGAIFAVAFNRAADRIATGGADGAIRIWKVGSVPLIADNMRPDAEQPDAHADGVMSVTFSPDDQLVASGGADNMVRFWNSDKLTPAAQLPTSQGHTAPVTSVAFNRDGTRLASGSNDKTVQLWDVARRERIGDPMIGHQGLVLSVAFSADGNEIISGGNERALRFWNTVGQPPNGPLVGHQGSVTSVAISPDGRQIASGGVDGTVRLWDSYSGNQIKEMPAPAGVVTRVAFTPSGDAVASGSADGNIRLWDLTTGGVRPIDTRRPVTAIAINRDGSHLASASIDGQITIWELPSGRATRLENKDHAIVFDLAFNPQGDRLASGGVAGMVRVWDVSGREIWEADAVTKLPKWFSDGKSLWHGRPGQVLGVAFSLDGRRLASGSTDWATAKLAQAIGVMQRWDADTGMALGDPAEIGAAVMGLAFSSQSSDPSQDRIVAAGFDPYTVQLWSATNGSQYTFTGYEGQVVSVAVSRDFTRIVSGSVDGTIRIWPNPSPIPATNALCDKLTTTMSEGHWNEWVSSKLRYRKLCPGLPPTAAGTAR